MNFIHHYTSIENLALILKYKTLRFKRLDLLDDKLEGGDFSVYNPLKYIFSSCWSKSIKENIPLWNMYSPIESRVRLTIDEKVDFFNEYAIPIRNILTMCYSENKELNSIIENGLSSPFNENGMDLKFRNSPLKPNKFCNEDYSVKIELNKDIFHEDVIYNDNYLDIY